MESNAASQSLDQGRGDQQECLNRLLMEVAALRRENNKINQTVEELKAQVKPRRKLFKRDTDTECSDAVRRVYKELCHREARGEENSFQFDFTERRCNISAKKSKCFPQNKTDAVKFPVQWNQTMANDLKQDYAINQDITVSCLINGIENGGGALKPNFLPLREKTENCSASTVNNTHYLNPGASYCTVSGSKGLGTSFVNTVLVLFVAVVIK